MIFEIAGFVVFIVLLSFFQIWHSIRNAGAKEVAVYILFMTVACVIGCLLIAGVEIPSQTAVSKIFIPIGKALLGE